jgi:tetratricopeptide (TPR) repeat protein/tRNA A-37 threonylcarbamoyl transferase component Bud32
LLAEDTELNRPVALKRIRDRRADDVDSRRRFLREAEITARLQHPGIVPVYGLTYDDHGRPCYAMRFIEGQSLQDALKQFYGKFSLSPSGGEETPASNGVRAPDFQSLTFRQLLQQLIAVCNTIAYAHSRGVLHRDLKPANIMLGKFGETLVVDWGLAKHFDRSDTERESGEETLAPSSGSDSSSTELGEAIGTPAFMSPEQAAGDWDTVGPAADVFSLGTILYQILTGQPPYRGKTALALDKARRWDFANPRQLAPRAPRALEAICLKAMAKVPTDRYPSPKAMAEDLERWLADEPVKVCHEPWTARLWRWGRRHKTAVLTALVGIVALKITLGVGAWLLNTANKEISQQRAAAETKSAEAEERKKDAEHNLERSLLAIRFLGDILGHADPKRPPAGDDISAAAALDIADAKVGNAFPGQPDAEAAVRNVLGKIYTSLGRFPEALKNCEAAYENSRRLLGADHPQTLEALYGLAKLQLHRGQLNEAEQGMRETSDGYRRILGPSHDLTLISQGSLGWILKRQRRLPEAEKLLRQTLEAQIQTQGPDHPRTYVTRGSLAGVLAEMRQFEEAEKLIRQVLDGDRRQLGSDHAETYITLGNLAQVVYVQGKIAEAEPLYREAFAGQRRILGPAHPDTMATGRVLAGLLNDRAQWSEAESILRELLPHARKLYPADHPELSGFLSALGWSLSESNRASEAEPYLRECVAIRKKSLPPKNWATANAESLLGGCLASLGRFAEAESMLVDSYEILAAARDCPPLRAGQSRDRVVRMYERWGKPDRAKEWRAKPPNP